MREISTRDTASRVCKSSAAAQSTLLQLTIRGGSRELVFLDGCVGTYSSFECISRFWRNNANDYSVTGATINTCRLANCLVVASRVNNSTLESCTIVDEILQTRDWPDDAKTSMGDRYCVLRGCYAEGCTMKGIKVCTILTWHFPLEYSEFPTIHRMVKKADWKFYHRFTDPRSLTARSPVVSLRLRSLKVRQKPTILPSRIAPYTKAIYSPAECLDVIE
jgi:hypothetical protein